MTMKKGTKRYYGVVVTIFLLLPVVFFAVFGKYFDTTNYENRTLAEKPVVGQTPVDEFPSDYEDWFNDHLPFRNLILTLNGYIDYRFFHTSSSDTCLVGKDGWLFYKGGARDDEDPVADYLGTNLFTEEELANIADNLEYIKSYLEERGCAFYLFLCPNKASIYSEYMPDSYGEITDYSRLDQVTDYLRENTDITVVSAKEEILAYKQEHPDTQLYYKYDTHWNAIGAYVGTRGLTEAMGYEQTPLEDCTIEDAGDYTYDLARMIHLSQILKDDGFYNITGYTPHNIQINEDASGLTYTYKTDSSAPGQRCMVVGDSFSAISAQYYVCHFQDAFQTYYYEYSLDELESFQPTVFVYEVVERYLGNLAKFSITDGLAVEEN